MKISMHFCAKSQIEMRPQSHHNSNEIRIFNDIDHDIGFDDNAALDNDYNEEDHDDGRCCLCVEQRVGLVIDEDDILRRNVRSMVVERGVNWVF